MRIECLEVGAFETNCYIVWLEAEKKLYVIDPGDEGAAIVKAAREFPFDSAEILLTHPHIDHINAVGPVAAALKLDRVFLRAPDHAIYRSPANCLPPYFPRPAENLPPPCEYGGNADFTVLALPGHTPGGAGFLFGDTLFSGDTLFYRSVGRTDLPGGDSAALERSVRDTLFALPESVRVLPGHGPETAIGAERRSNPYFGGAAR